jgi:tRNA pseudouridine(55) synthase
MLRYVVLEKSVGETPLMALNAWRDASPDYRNVVASYAGRLDPMASGKLLVLLGEECKRQREYTCLDKEYEIEVLLDVGSDTGDALGLVEYAHKHTRYDQTALVRALEAEKGWHTRPYPHFSSKTVDGKPLFLHALEGNLSAIHVPQHEEEIYTIKLEGVSHVRHETLVKRIKQYLGSVPRSEEPSKRLGADFRIEAVKDRWAGVLSEAGRREFVVLHLRVACGSGTYMRSLAPRIGQALDTKALALSIHRTKIGRYWWGLWLKKF